MPDVAAPLRDGRYRLVGILGAGGMATVYRSYDTRLGVYRAVKVLASNLAARPSVRNRFETEAMTMARLHHENIVMVHDVESELDRVYMVMEMLDGGSLHDLVQHAGPLPPRLACSLVRQVLAGLDVAHRIGVIHRDIKPANILLNREGVPKLTDFGIARVPDADHTETRSGVLLGTWAYMAPEQRASATRVEVRSDLYAIGMTLYSLLLDSDPFEPQAQSQALERVRAVCPDLVPLIERATAEAIEARPASAVAMAEELAAVERRLTESAPITELMPPVDASSRTAPAPSEPTSSDTFAFGETLLPPAEASAGPTIAPADSASPPSTPPTRRSRWPVLVALGLVVLSIGTAGVGGVALYSGVLTQAASLQEPNPAPEPAEAPTAERETAPTSAPQPVVAQPDTPAPVRPEPVRSEPAPAPQPVAPRPEPVAPRPEPDAQDTAPAPTPTPTPQPAVSEPAPTTGVVVLSNPPPGAYLMSGSRRESLGTVPAGIYQIRVPDESEDYGRVTVSPGQTVRLRCDLLLRMCRE